MAEYLVSKIFSTSAGFALELTCFRQDGVCLLLRNANDFLFAGNGNSLAASILNQTACLGFCLIKKSLTLTNNLTSLSELARERVANLVQDLKCSLSINLPKPAFTKRRRLRILDEHGELFDEIQYSCFVHIHPSEIAHAKQHTTT